MGEAFLDGPISAAGGIGLALLTSPMWVPVLAYQTAMAPVYLISDGVAFFVPPKVYEIVH